ncbi:MAG TPA: ABC transporter ATP-binding protein [candidate division Zixibacteria bacterium]|nr:ABC transporter ATP-binding protein [candidate division Zixibacteria bacterium]
MLSIELENISKRFGERQVFENINLKLESPASLALIGPNGCGKTTLLKIICGLIRPSRGKIRIKIDGQELKQEDQRAIFSIVASDIELYEELTALENLGFISHLRNSKHSEIELNQKLERVGLKDRGNEPVGAFSSGMKQRLKYAVALSVSPQILILDEPSSNLDEEGVFLMEKIIEEQKKSGMVILATNDLKETQYAQQTYKLVN